MAKGSVAKQEIFDKMLNFFDNSFMYNGGKELRIPWEENGVNLEIKVTLTCAKDIVGAAPLNKEGDAIKEDTVAASFPQPKTAPLVEPTIEEKENVEKLLESLGLK